MAKISTLRLLGRVLIVILHGSSSWENSDLSTNNKEQVHLWSTDDLWTLIQSAQQLYDGWFYIPTSQMIKPML